MNVTPKSSPVRLRRDLQIFHYPSADARAAQHEGQVCWVHNPVSGIAVRLDKSSFQQLRNGDVTQDTPLALEARNYELLSGSPVSSAVNKPQPRWWKNPLFIRIPGIPADGIAVCLAQYLGWVFAGPVVCVWMLCFIVTAIALLVNAKELWSSLTTLASFQLEHWFLSLCILACTKVSHELAHAAVCRRMGAPCRQIGALLLCGTPCLYCDVSDSWRIASRFRRSAVMLAGIYVELILATISSWIWLTSEPSMLRMLALHVMMVCGVSTIVFNINPLMRYDGYFVLSDLLNVNNLRLQAKNTWNQVIFYPLAGIRSPAARSLPEVMHGESASKASLAFRAFLVVYHGLSGVYRYVVVAGIASWLYYVSVQCSLEPLGRMLVIIVCGAIAIGLVGRWVKMMKGSGIWRHVSMVRRLVFGVTVVGLLGVLLVTPWHRRITAYGAVDYMDATAIYLPEDGLVSAVYADFGDVVAAGQRLVDVDSSSLRLQRPDLMAQVSRLELTVQSLKSRATLEPELLEQLNTTNAMLDAAQRKLQRLDRQLDSLALTTPTSGQVIRPQVASTAENRWTRLSDQVGAESAKGKLWCRIGDSQSKHVVLSIDAAQRAAVKLDSTVRLRIHSLPLSHAGGIIDCPISQVSEARVDQRINPLASSQDRFEITCQLPVEVAGRVVTGSRVTGVFKGDAVTLSELFTTLLLGAVR